MHVGCGWEAHEHQYLYETRPKNVKDPVGAPRFPLWNYLEGEMQAMDMPRQILEGTPYPLRAVFALGMNARMFPNSGRMFKALESLDFFVDTDLFMTDAAKYADIVLPACSSFERGEFKPYPGGTAWYTSPAIQPLGQAKSDTDIVTELARYMDLPDEQLKEGYESFVQKYILDDLGFTVEQLKKMFTGEITNWKDVGGNDAEIVLIGREAGSGTRDGFESITDTKDACQYRQELTSTGDVITTVSQNPNAIGYASLAAIKDSVKALTVNGVAPTEATVKDGTYLVQRPFVLVTKEGTALSETAQKFFDFATSADAASIISAAGAVPVA